MLTFPIRIRTLTLVCFCSDVLILYIMPSWLDEIIKAEINRDEIIMGLGERSWYFFFRSIFEHLPLKCHFHLRYTVQVFGTELVLCSSSFRLNSHIFSGF